MLGLDFSKVHSPDIKVIVFTNDIIENGVKYSCKTNNSQYINN